jgi:glycerol-3-phosphate acyltransferase PlsY
LTALTGIVGYLIGSIPTASFLGRLRGVDLRTEGSGNPGTANALRISGLWLASLVLIVEAAKGYGAVWLGALLADEIGAVAAGLGAVGGNVYNLWYRFRGGKGLGISLGVLAAVWPAVILPIVVVTLVGVLISRSSGIASLAAIAALIAMAIIWSAYELPTGGVASTSRLLVLALGVALIISWRHWRDVPFNEPARR